MPMGHLNGEVRQIMGIKMLEWSGEIFWSRCLAHGDGGLVPTELMDWEEGLRRITPEGSGALLKKSTLNDEMMTEIVIDVFPSSQYVYSLFLLNDLGLPVLG